MAQNLKEGIESRRRKIDEASGYGDLGTTKKKNKKRSYEEDFGSEASISELEQELERIKAKLSRKLSKDERQKLTRRKYRIAAELKLAKEER
jgi:hypothetical protein